MNARSRSGNRGPTSASIPSANAVSVDIAIPQPCADEPAGVEGEVDRDRDRPSRRARPRAAARTAGARAARRGRTRAAPRARRRRRRTSSARCSPSRAGRATIAVPAEVDREHRRPDAVVRRRRRRSPTTSAARAAASRTAAPPVSVRRNSRSGVSRFRAQAVRPEKRRAVSPPLLFELTGPSNPSGAHIGLDPAECPLVGLNPSLSEGSSVLGYEDAPNGTSDDLSLTGVVETENVEARNPAV